MIAARIADVVEQEGGRVHLENVVEIHGALDLRAFDVVVLAGAVMWGRHARRLRRFIRQNIVLLSSIRSVLVSVSNAACSAEGRPVAEEYARRLFRETGWQADSLVLFGGGATFTKYGFFTRLVMTRVEREHGRGTERTRDYDYTDWEAVDAFARSLARDKGRVARGA
jgi:menaquinone-dependent protoporphyrinogen oxidase